MNRTPNAPARLRQPGAALPASSGRARFANAAAGLKNLHQLIQLRWVAVVGQLLTIEAALTRKRDRIYQAALLDPHTSSELSIDDTIAMCDALIDAHGTMMPKYR